VFGFDTLSHIDTDLGNPFEISVHMATRDSTSAKAQLWTVAPNAEEARESLTDGEDEDVNVSKDSVSVFC
jgi:hypothetical protein